MTALSDPGNPIPADPRTWGAWMRRQLATAEDSGYFGPDSTVWRLHREAAMSLGLARALLLQVAHPWVAQAVVDHSTFQSRPADRLATTVSAAELMVFGSRRQADEIASRIRAVHTHIHGVLTEDVGRWKAGTPYTAEDSDSLLWVLVTLMETTLAVHETLFGPLSDRDVTSYLRDASRIGVMLGMRGKDAPRDRSELHDYMREQMESGTVAVGRAGQSLAKSLLTASYLPLQTRLAIWPYRTVSRLMAGALMPEPLRSQFGPILEVPPAILRRVGRIGGRALLSRLPERVRFDPIASTAVARFKADAA